MKTLLKGFIPLFLLLGIVSGCTDRPMTKKSKSIMESYVGYWKVSDTKGDNYYITLSSSRNATSTYRNGEKGKWSLMGDRAVVTWRDGWKAMFYRDGKDFKVRTFAPGVDIESKPYHVSFAEKVSAVPR